VAYSANGEASDYMLAEAGIYALSAELGTSEKKSDTFFITSHTVLESVLSENYKWFDYAI
jgi:hypothetical protein